MKKNKNELINELTADMNRSITDLVKILLSNKADILDLKDEMTKIKNILKENESRCAENI